MEEAPTFHTISGEAAVLSVHQIGSFANDTGLDFLTNSSSKILPSKPKAAINESQDLIDYLANTSSAPRAVRLELTVDGRVVSDKVATEYLREIRDLVDQSQ